MSIFYEVNLSSLQQNHIYSFLKLDPAVHHAVTKSFLKSQSKLQLFLPLCCMEVRVQVLICSDSKCSRSLIFQVQSYSVGMASVPSSLVYILHSPLAWGGLACWEGLIPLFDWFVLISLPLKTVCQPHVLWIPVLQLHAGENVSSMYYFMCTSTRTISIW